MSHILLYGKEHTFLDSKTGLLFRNSSFKETAPLHTHTFYEVFIVTSGKALHLVNNAIQTVARGDIILIRPSDTHSYEFYYSEDFRIINVGFSRQIFRDIQIFLGNAEMMRPLIESDLPVCIHTGGLEQEYIVSKFMEIGSLMQTTDILKTVVFAKCCIADVIARCFFRYGDNPSGSKYPAWFRSMLSEMQKIDNLRIGYPKMLELSFCSSNHLSRVFKSILAVTPTEYINEKRLEYSVYLLTQTNEDITEISLSCGFTSLSHFYHLFKRQYQCSPDKFRKGFSK